MSQGVEHTIKEQGLEALGRFYSSYRGYVYDNEDPGHIGRLQVYVPEIYGEEPHDYWAMPKGMIAGKEMGMYWVPNKKDPVWVEFQNGDPRFPIWEYAIWDKNDPPKDVDGNAVTPNIKLLYSKKHKLQFDDEGNKITILDGTGNKVVMDDYGISVVPKTGKKISLGKLDGSAQPALMGDDTKQWLSDLIDAIIQITVPTAFGPSGVPINATVFTTLKAQLSNLLSKVVNLEKGT